jgi:type VI secretion system protein ImpH
MAGEAGTTPDPLTQALNDALRAAPWSFDFFQAVRRLECAHRQRPRVGYSSHVTEDPVRFGQEPSLAFAPAALSRYTLDADARSPRLSVHFLGLLGPNGPMPIHFTDFVRDRQRNHDATLARFLDIFHHRMISFFYRAWACNQQTVSFDRPENDRFGGYVASLIGMGMASFRDRDAAPDIAKLHYAGALANQTHHADGLASLLEDYLGIKTQIEQCVGQWLILPPESSCRLGASRESGLLGQTLIIGSRIWDCQQKFRIRLGPMNFKQYSRLLPGGKSLARVVAWVKNYIGDELEWDARLVLKKDEIPKTRLGQLGQLGWTTWIHSKPMKRDADDLVLRPQAA